MKLTIAQIALESVEFRHRVDFPPNVPLPPSTVEMNGQVARVDQNPNGAAIVRLTTVSADDAIYQFRITYAALYLMEWEQGEAIPEDLDQRLLVTGSTMLFPFARETVASITGRARYGPTWLAPTDFNAMAFAVSAPQAQAGP
jgi:preprotein translocase subunit SecB